MKKYALMLVAALILVIVAGKPASAQIDSKVKADIPFPFYVDNPQLPPGKYSITRILDTDPKILELRSADVKTG